MMKMPDGHVPKRQSKGKTMAADMICAYYDQTAESRELFEHQGCCKVDEFRNEAERQMVEIPGFSLI